MPKWTEEVGNLQKSIGNLDARPGPGTREQATLAAAEQDRHSPGSAEPKKEFMRTKDILMDLHTSLTFHKWVVTNTLALCLLPAVTAFAQQGFEEGPIATRQDAAGTVTKNNDDGNVGSSSQENRTQSSMPDAPSISRHVPSNGSSLTFGERSRIYAHSIFRPYSLVGPALGAGIGQWENAPPQWGEGGEGYARRFGSGVGRHLIAETIRFAAAAADGEDPRYHRSDETGVWARARHAIVETFTSQTGNGTRIPAFSRFAGAYGAAFVSNLWYPDPRATTGWALRRGSTALGASIGFHLFEEFVPRKRDRD
jgi:hypothetical protein